MNIFAVENPIICHKKRARAVIDLHLLALYVRNFNINKVALFLKIVPGRNQILTSPIVDEMKEARYVYIVST